MSREDEGDAEVKCACEVDTMNGIEYCAMHKAAPELLDICYAIERAACLWLPATIEEEHADEARALHALRARLLAAIQKTEAP